MTINVLYVVDRDQYIHKMSRVRFHAIEALSKLTNVITWGPKWRFFDDSKDLNENIKTLSKKIDVVICYKPSSVINFEKFDGLKVMTYNEMWDEPYTLNEINHARPDVVICHHENDMHRYKKGIYKDLSCFFKLHHIHHSGEKTVFYDRKCKKDIDVLLCGSIGRHYPLRKRLHNVMRIITEKSAERSEGSYVCSTYKHPGYILQDAFTDVYLNDFAENICKSKICITCSSKYKYLLGKLVEIPLCGSVVASDLPDQDHDTFKKTMIVLDDKKTDEELADVLINHLDNPDKLEKIRLSSIKASQKWTQEDYAQQLLKIIKSHLNNKIVKVFVIADELKSIKEKWICDILKDEFMNHVKNDNKENMNMQIVKNSGDADIIWLLAPWSQRKVNRKHLEEKFVISTMHHIDWDKYESNKNYYDLIDRITNRYHCICPNAYESLRKITSKDIIVENFWINSNNFYEITDKKTLRKKYNLPDNSFIVGSFQKDTEGADDSKPKLSKGPDIFVEIVNDMKKAGKNIFVLLTGWRRSYVINELKKRDIPYIFLELVPMSDLNELYNCLDLYLVSSRVEGGPRSIVECGLARVPIISSMVGIAELILPESSIYNQEKWKSYRKVRPDVETAYANSVKYTIKNHMNHFINKIFYETSKTR